MNKTNNKILFSTKERAAIKHLIDIRFGKTTTASDYTQNNGSPVPIEQEIFGKTGKQLSGSTLKRLVGLVPRENNTNVSLANLDIVSEYLHFKNIDAFIKQIEIISKFNSLSEKRFSFSEYVTTVNFDNENQLKLIHINDSYFEVKGVTGIDSIKTGDELQVIKMKKGDIFMCEKVMRTIDGVGKSLGEFSSGEHKVSFIELDNILSEQNEQHTSTRIE